MVDSVLGAVDPEDLGFTLMHEHIVSVNPSMTQAFTSWFNRQETISMAVKQHYVDPRLMMDPFLKIEADKYWNDLKKTIISAWTEEYITDSSWDEREQSREIP